MNIVAGSTPRVVLPNVRVDGDPLTTIQTGESVRYAFLDSDGVIADEGDMTHDTNGTWIADADAPIDPGHYLVVCTVKVGDKNDEFSARVEVDSRRVALT